jgi:hypothetical protein
MDITTCSATDTTFEPETWGVNTKCVGLRCLRKHMGHRAYLQYLDLVIYSSVEIDVI